MNKWMNGPGPRVTSRLSLQISDQSFGKATTAGLEGSPIQLLTEPDVA